MSSSNYNSPRRKESAATTRQAILTAARKLFTERGYVATTVGDIAQEARVATATVYTSVGGKPRLLEAIAQVDASDPRLAELLDAMEHTDDPHEAIRRAAAANRHSAESHADLFELMLMTAQLDEAVDATTQEGERWFRHGSRRLAERLHELAALRVSVDDAVDILAYFFGYLSWRRLVTDFGWSYPEAEAWLTTRVTEALITKD